MVQEWCSIPKEGQDQESILEEIVARKEDDADWQEGKVWSLVYSGGEDIANVRDQAYQMLASENALSPSAFPSLRKFENEVVAMTAGLFEGDEDTVGQMTSGGTESILLAVKAARDYASTNQPERNPPEIVMPETAHPAFAKAAHYFSLEINRVKTNSSWRADRKTIENAISEDTILIVTSAPSYPHGVIDPIEEIADVAAKNDILCHVDCCIGGFILPFLRQEGHDLPNFDFSVPGVTSISADPHKYGYTAKGASTIMYSNEELRRYQYFAYDGWPGGVYAAPNLSGTRPGGPIAAAWAVMKYIGHDGYVSLAKRTMKTTDRLKQGINKINGLEVVSDPDMTIFSFECVSDKNIMDIHKKLTKKGWVVGRQMEPPSIHLSVMQTHSEVVDKFLTDLEESTSLARDQNEEDSTALYGGSDTVNKGREPTEVAIKSISNSYKLDGNEQ